MKCIKPAKSYTVGEIRRVNDNEAEERVNNGYWKYVTKTEWRESKGIKKEESVKTEA